MDWKFSLEALTNKVKYQLHAKGVDSLGGIFKYF